VFQQLGEHIGNYYNIKLFTTLPMMAELNVHSKTIIQCLVKDNAKLMLTADYAFPFQAQFSNTCRKYKATINGNTLTSASIQEQPKKEEEKIIFVIPIQTLLSNTEGKAL
jgi:hypothetical protein